jgi:hypothetical protein
MCSGPPVCNFSAYPAQWWSSISYAREPNVRTKPVVSPAGQSEVSRKALICMDDQRKKRIHQASMGLVWREEITPMVLQHLEGICGITVATLV